MEGSNRDAEDFGSAWVNFLGKIGENGAREGLQRTPQRFLSGLGELLQSTTETGAVESILQPTFDAPRYDDWILLQDIPFHSLCEHHLLPFHGTVSVAYWPAEARVVGLSKMVRLVDHFARRLQLQERLTVQIAEAIHGTLKTKAVAVSIEAGHLCMEVRGVQRRGIRTTTFHRCGQADRWPF